ncbi:MAG: type II secretion system protein [Thermoguttaceae bacterium]
MVVAHLQPLVTVPRRLPAFTLIEALVAISLTALAGSALLMGSVSSLQTTDNARQQAIALGMAQQLMDEVVGNRYVDDSGNAYAWPLQPGGNEVSGVSRALFDDIGDFNGYRCMPPTDPWGIPLGTDDGSGGLRDPNFQAAPGPFTHWRQEIDVAYVSESNLTTPLSGSQTSDYRLVSVRIMYVDPTSGQARQLAQVQQVVAYVPPLQ